MTDYCISAVSYDSEEKHIEFVRVHKLTGTHVGEGMVSAREFVADLISSKKATFQTIVPGVTTKWKEGAQVHVVDEVYLTTEPNSTKRDNLGSLKTF
ncbi:DUF3892 domain-containing protein [Pseudomonas syringae]|uniref:DUF3892 domain-containing protein n=1 Tax=Pseudomonas syringae TaxID=317 RepID=UPI001BCB6DAB|nr:DUF3892 domain-containing protein [Pseudomonas syringae]MBS7440597.1 DUF3892 domain-containing protein [Pseudomonas syringae]